MEIDEDTGMERGYNEKLGTAFEAAAALYEKEKEQSVFPLKRIIGQQTISSAVSDFNPFGCSTTTTTKEDPNSLDPDQCKVHASVGWVE